MEGIWSAFKGVLSLLVLDLSFSSFPRLHIFSRDSLFDWIVLSSGGVLFGS